VYAQGAFSADCEDDGHDSAHERHTLEEMKWWLWSSLTLALLLAACNDAPARTETELFFPTRPGAGFGGNHALFRGSLVVRDGCVLIGGPGDYALPIWWEGFAAERDESGRVVVQNGEGAVVAIEDEIFEMGGGYTAEWPDKDEPRRDQLGAVEEWIGYSIPERCLGPGVHGVWVVGNT
jgi:hypothetical protein